MLRKVRRREEREAGVCEREVKEAVEVKRERDAGVCEGEERDAKEEMEEWRG